MANITLNDIYMYVGKENYQFARNKDRYRFLLESYEGGITYRRGAHLTKYVLETDSEYQARLERTPLDNHCRSVVSVYVSFLFRSPPERDLGMLEYDPQVKEFLKDCDYDGRSLDQFMKEVATWSSVFGHAWILMTKPAVEAVSLADQQLQGVRPYVNILTPLVVTDWAWERMPNGRYELNYFKYVEDVNDTVVTVREWDREFIRTYIVDEEKKEANLTEEIPNQLGVIPVVLVYNQRSQVRGIGVSDIDDIADQQRAIYNELSEVEQSVRLEGHPSLVMTSDTQVGSGAGAIVIMAENLDPGLKPYMLNVDAVPIASLYESIKNRVQSIDRMANTGSVRATETRDISGIALQTEFQLLNAKLSEKADNLDNAEEQMWRLYCRYEGKTWDGEIHYPDEFNIRDTKREFDELLVAKQAATSPAVTAVVDYKIMEALDEEPEEVVDAVSSLLGIPDPEVVGTMSARSELEEYQKWVMISPDGGKIEDVESPMVREQYLAQGWRDYVPQ